MADNRVIVELGTVIKNRGEWDSLAQNAKLYKDNVVQYNGSAYIVKSAPASGIGKDILPTNTAYYEVFAGVGEVATGSDFDAPSAAQRGKITTVGAVLDGMNDGVYNLTAKTGDSYATLNDALIAANNTIPINKKRGGMSICFINSSDHKYVQYRYMGTDTTASAFTNIANWQGADDISVDSGIGTKDVLSFVDVNDNCVMEVKDGHIKTKKFDSRDVTTKTYVDTKIATDIDAAKEEIDIEISESVATIEEKVAEVDNIEEDEESMSFVDENDECIVQLKDGHIKTKEFDSRDAATKDYVDDEVDGVQDAVEALGDRTAEVDDEEDDEESLSFVDESSECIAQFKEGHIKTKEFDSRNAATKEELNDLQEKVAEVDNIDNNDEKLAVVDEESNCIVLFKDGHIKTKKFDSRTAATTPSPDIVIPNNIYAVVDDTLQIFFKSILNCSNYKNYGIVVSCDIGKSFHRYYEVKPAASNIGNHNLTVHVYDINGNIIKQKTVALIVVAKLNPQSPAKNILTVGASTYTSGGIISEVNRRFGANSGDGTPANPTGLGITGINFIGRKEAADIHQEATGGYSWKIYATNALKYVRFYISGVSAVNLDAKYYIEGVSITQTYYFKVIEVNMTDGIGNILCEVYGGYIYSSLPENGVLIKIGGTGDAQITYSSYLFEDGNPFWHEGAVDFQHYSEQYCNGVDIDVLYTHLGLNGFYTKERVDESIENYVKPFIRKYHTDYPNGKFILGTLQLGSPNGGYGSVGYANLQQNWYNLSDVYWYALEKYKEISESSEFSSYVSITDCTAEFDCEYGYPETNKAVNNRVSTTEIIQTNQIHPTETAKKMISDSIYRTLTKLLN